MAGLRFFRTPKPQRFEYKARFYDPEKEELRARVQRAEKEEDYSAEEVKRRISSSFRSKTSGYKVDRNFRSKQVKNSNRRLFMIIAFLIIAGYLLVKFNLSSFTSMIEGVSGY
ncbi:MAG: hypothetical protein AAGI23_10055 [Bacteroidota bacterium]